VEVPSNTPKFIVIFVSLYLHVAFFETGAALTDTQKMQPFKTARTEKIMQKDNTLTYEH